MKSISADGHEQDYSFCFDVFFKKLAKIHLFHGWHFVVEYQEKHLFAGIEVQFSQRGLFGL